VEKGRASTRPVEVRAFPRDDRSFHDAAAAALERSESPADLQRRLRLRYPAAVVRPRDRIADPGMGPDIWYAYRYGSADAVTRWWTDPKLPWAILDDDRRFVDVDPALAAIIEAPRDDVVGRRVEDFTNPADATVVADIAALWAQFLVGGELHATMRFRRLDGSPRDLEYHLRRNGAGDGRHLAVVRELVEASD